MDVNGSRLPTVAPGASHRPLATPDGKPRGANRTTKSTGKLQVLPDQPEPAVAGVVGQLQKPELPKIKPPPRSGIEASIPSSASAHTDEEEEEEETEETEEQDAEVSTLHSGLAL